MRLTSRAAHALRSGLGYVDRAGRALRGMPPVAAPSAPPAARPGRLLAAAQQAGWRLTPANRAFLGRLDRAVRSTPARGAAPGQSPRVAVLVSGGPRPGDLVDVLATAHPECLLTRVDVSTGPSPVHAALAAAGRLDVLVDDVRRGRGRADLFRRSLPHLDDGGVLLVRRFPAGTRELERRGEESVARLLARLMEREGPAGAAVGRRQQDEAALAASLRRTVLDRGHLGVTRTGRAYAKLTEPEANEVLSLRGCRAGRVVSVLDPLRLRSRCVLRESPSFRNGGLPDGFDVPAMSHREYLDVVCAPGQVVLQDNLLLPDTYRQNQGRRLGNYLTRELGPRFAEPRHDPAPRSELSGSYYFLDSEYSGHFGHLLTEQLSRLWAWPAAKRADPSLRALVAVTREPRELAGFETALFAAAGIEPEDIEVAVGPVRVERLVAATPMMSHPAYVHPGVEEVWARTGRALVAASPGDAVPRRLFCSRREQNGPGVFRGSRRVCRNASEVEAMFVAHGFTVVHPEEFPLAVQARMFAEAEVVAGYAGSAMFNLVFCPRPVRVVLVSSESYTAKNEYLVASVLGHHLDVAWCRAETPMPEGRWDREAFTSAFTFDFEREGRFLADVLDGL
jgi:capsular polysaccharide biosynthesis protein